MIWVPTCIGVLASQDETGVEIHAKERTDTDDSDWHSAEKHVWTASAEERTHSRGTWLINNGWCTYIVCVFAIRDFCCSSKAEKSVLQKEAQLHEHWRK